MSESVTSGGKRLRVEKPGSTPQLVLWKHLLPLLRSIVRRMGGDLQIDGAESFRMGEDGQLSFKISPGAAVTPPPFTISSTGKIAPGFVGSQMPTLGGEPLNTTTNVIDMTADGGTFLVWFKLTFTPVFSGSQSILSSYSYDSAEVETGTTKPADTADEKYLEFCAVTDGKPSAPYFSISLSVDLADNGSNDTTLLWNV